LIKSLIFKDEVPIVARERRLTGHRTSRITTREDGGHRAVVSFPVSFAVRAVDARVKSTGTRTKQ